MDQRLKSFMRQIFLLNLIFNQLSNLITIALMLMTSVQTKDILKDMTRSKSFDFTHFQHHH